MSKDMERDSSFDPLDAGLRAGFGPTPSPRGSVIGCLEDRTGSMLRLNLPDVDSDRDPIVKPFGAEKVTTLAARYQVVGEIARGGLGVVMKTRDLDLGRDVAIKVLHERFKNDRPVIERFVEEAQIGGQLQHPGIVPVYELGLQDDERPFFAMKLVKGETLAALLNKRRSPSEGLQRFLRVFLQVCQTIAYAHVRRVVHRDLKPSNILVGAFGEVQVVDWGLAKVLQGGVERADEARPSDASVIETVRSAEGSSHSIAGSVMGTPAYMPPEQARGDVDRLDTRSDVFALGALLCEILSGVAPYESDDRAAALVDARDCRTGAALQRLAACGADEDIVELARSCLAAAQSARPQDAGELARRVEAYLHSVDERARRAEVRAAELRVRARSALVVAGLVIAGIATAGWVYWSWSGHRSERMADTARRAGTALGEASRLAGQAEQAQLAGVALWGEALAAARRAAEIVAAGEADAELEQRVATLLADVEQREATTREAALREAAHGLWLERVVEARIGPDVPRFDLFQGPERRRREATRRAEAYASLFEEIGYRESMSVEEVAGHFGSHHRERFAVAFDAWAEARRLRALFLEEDDPRAQPNAWRTLTRAARRLDPEDPWRNALRDEVGRGSLDVTALRELARPDVLRERSAEEIAILVALLEAAGDVRGAVEAQLEGIVLHPDDFWLSVSLGNLCAQEELIGRLFGSRVSWATRAAVLLRPESRWARFNLALSASNEHDVDVLGLFRELRSEIPDDPILQATEFMFLMEAGEFDGAAGRLPDVLPALQVVQADWDYAPFIAKLGYGELLFETPGVAPVSLGLLHLCFDRYDEAWAAIEANRDQLRPRWPWLYLPTALANVGSAEELRDEVARLRSLLTADESVLRSTSSVDLLAATELVADGWNGLAPAVRLFAQAFENDPASKEIWTAARARQVAAFSAALASGVGTDGDAPLPPEQRAALRRQALDWMHEELDVIESDLRSPDASAEMATNYSRVFNQMNVYGWLAPIREPRFLAQMSPEEAHECRFLWARIRGLEAMLVDLFAS